MARGQLLLLTQLDNLHIVVQEGCNDGHHIGFDYSCPYCLGTANSYIHDALKGEIPFPHFHRIGAPALFEDADQSFNSAINGEDITDPC